MNPPDDKAVSMDDFSMRDLFALVAMHALFAREHDIPLDTSIARYAYSHADAMLAQRSKQ